MSLLALNAAIARCASNEGKGSGSVSPLFSFIAGKRPVESRGPGADSRQRVLPTHSGQTTCSKPVSQPISNVRTGMPVGGRWRPRPIGHKRSVEVAVQFEYPRFRPPSLNGRFPASKLTVVLPQGGQFRTLDISFKIVNNQSNRHSSACTVLTVPHRSLKPLGESSNAHRRAHYLASPFESNSRSSGWRSPFYLAS